MKSALLPTATIPELTFAISAESRVDAAIMRFLAADDVILDREFFLHDIDARKAHVEGLARIGALSADEASALARELDALARDFRAGTFILDSRYEDFKFPLTDVVADNASAGGFYLGPVARRPEELEDLRLIGCIVRVDGEVVMTAAGAAVMGHPAAAVAWLANQLAAEGEGLKAGQLVFSGGVTAPVPVTAGGSVTFEFDGLGAIEIAGA